MKNKPKEEQPKKPIYVPSLAILTLQEYNDIPKYMKGLFQNYIITIFRQNIKVRICVNSWIILNILQDDYNMKESTPL